MKLLFLFDFSIPVISFCLVLVETRYYIKDVYLIEKFYYTSVWEVSFFPSWKTKIITSFNLWVVEVQHVFNFCFFFILALRKWLNKLAACIQSSIKSFQSKVTIDTDGKNWKVFTLIVSSCETIINNINRKVLKISSSH